MKFDPNNIPPGLSWGARGFRIGRGASGRWWMSLSFMGFRYYWYLSKGHASLKKDEENIKTETSKSLPSYANKTSSSKNHFATKSTSKIKRN